MFLKKILFVVLLLASIQSWANIYVKNCGYYGPASDNLVLYIEAELDAFEVGYTVAEAYFKLPIKGCEELSLRANELFCDERAIGQVSNRYFNVLDHLGFSQSVRLLDLYPEAYIITGACNDNSLRLIIN